MRKKMEKFIWWNLNTIPGIEMSDIDICKAGVTTCHVCGGDGVCEYDDLCKTISF
jgi:hypothetical protein